MCIDLCPYMYFLISSFFVGESGLGKSTLLNSLFLTDIYTPAAYPSVEERLKKTVAVSTSCYCHLVRSLWAASNK